MTDDLSFILQLLPRTSFTISCATFADIDIGYLGVKMAQLR